MSYSDWPKLAATLAQLEGLYTYVSAQNALSLVLVSAEARSGNRTHLGVIRRNLDRLGPSGELGKAVVSGTISTERWVGVANEQGRGLNQVLSSLEEESSRFWNEVVITTGQDVVTVAKTATVGGGISLAVLALIYVVLKATK